MSSWGYGTNDGPNTWGINYHHANGKNQSPIDINTREVKFDPSLSHDPLIITYEEETKMEIGNNGHSIKADTQKDSCIKGGPLLAESYKLAQFHFHWGSVNTKGSEHTVNGKCYAGELHLVHWNSKKYDTFADAAQADGIAVIGIFIKIGRNHEGFGLLVNAMEEVKYKNQQSHIPKFDPSCLLPGNTTHYWTYPGSLTTPPCCESVKWIVMADTIDISEDQVVALRGLFGDEKGGSSCHPIQDNFRPVLPVNNRTVRSSWRLKEVK